MRSKWYGNKRDLVKWSTLFALAVQVHVPKILQVTCLVPDDHGGGNHEYGDLAIDFGSEVADAVWRHFRNLEGVVELGRKIRADVAVVPDEYPSALVDRDAYFGFVARTWLKPDHEPLIVLLDPDVGLGKTRMHVSPEQVGTVKRALKPGDWLVLYQSAPMFAKGGWEQQKQKEFAVALGVPFDSVQRRLSSVATDVTFLVWEANEAGREGKSRLARWLGRR